MIQVRIKHANKMPHICIGMLPGRTPEQKTALAHKIRELVSAELNVDKMIVSVSMEDVELADWDGFMSKIPDDSIIIPEANTNDEKYKKCSCNFC